MALMTVAWMLPLVRSRNLAAPIVLAMLCGGCFKDEGPRVHKGYDALALLDRLIAEEAKVRERLKDRSFRVDYVIDEDLDGAYHGSAGVHEEGHITAANNNSFVERVHTANQCRSARFDEGTTKVKDLINADYHYHWFSSPHAGELARFYARPNEPELQVPGLPWFIYDNSVFSVAPLLLSKLEVALLGANREIEEIPSDASTPMPLYVLRLFDKGGDLSSEVTIDPNKDYCVVNVRDYNVRGQFVETEITVAVSRHENLEGQPWLADMYNCLIYLQPNNGEKRGIASHSSVLKVRSFEMDIALPPDYFTVQRLNLAEGQEVMEVANAEGEPYAKIDGEWIHKDLPLNEESCVYTNGDLLCKDHALIGAGSRKGGQSNSVLTYSSRLSEGMDLSEVCDLLGAEGQGKGMTGTVSLREWSDASGTLEATFKEGKLIRWTPHPAAQETGKPGIEPEAVK